MKTLITIVKDHDKNIVTRDCQMQDVFYLFEKNRIPFDYPSFLLTFCLKSFLYRLLWTTFET